jgi:hypothetical protein
MAEASSINAAGGLGGVPERDDLRWGSRLAKALEVMRIFYRDGPRWYVPHIQFRDECLSEHWF